MLTAKLVGDTELIERLTNMPVRIRSGLARAVTQLSLEGAQLSKRKVSGEVLKVRSGALRASIKPNPTKITAVGAEGGWGTDSKYGRIQEEGVPHSWEIMPKSARALAFEVNGQTIFAMRVTHPPLPAHSFIGSALRELEPRIEEVLGAAVWEEIQKA